MNVRQFALVLGVVFLLVGVAGFIPGLNHNMTMHDPNLSVDGPGEGHLLGLFHVNVLHNVVHLLFGVLGIAAAYGGWARNYARFVAVAYGLLAILGLIPTANINHTFGLIPIEGNDVWQHALIALVAAIFGWGVGTEIAPNTAHLDVTDMGTTTRT
jgi:hypothetical protein